jgi:precorrin-6B methylase 2
LITELLLSPYVSVTKGVTCETSAEQESVAKNFHRYFSPYTDGRHTITAYDASSPASEEKSDIVCVFNTLNGASDADQMLLTSAWEQVKPNGLLVVYEDLGANYQTTSAENLDKMLETFGTVQFYSSIVASRIQENTEISHYSTIQEDHLVKEKRDKTKVFRVINKAP